jgi:hypothetical protein
MGFYCDPELTTAVCTHWKTNPFLPTTVNQHPPEMACYYLDVDEPQLELIFGFTLVTNSVGK